MSEILDKNKEYASVMKEVMKLRYEPVAVKLVKEGEEFPAGYSEPAEQQSHCQSIFRAKDGACFKMPLECHNCNVGASALGMVPTPDKVASGEFHAGIGMHDSPAAAAKMISDRMVVPYKVIGTVVCPLKDADFIPDVVAIDDIPERIYWIVPLTRPRREAVSGSAHRRSSAPARMWWRYLSAQDSPTSRSDASDAGRRRA